MQNSSILDQINCNNGRKRSNCNTNSSSNGSSNCSKSLNSSNGSSLSVSSCCSGIIGCIKVESSKFPILPGKEIIMILSAQSILIISYIISIIALIFLVMAVILFFYFTSSQCRYIALQLLLLINSDLNDHLLYLFSLNLKLCPIASYDWQTKICFNLKIIE